MGHGVAGDGVQSCGGEGHGASVDKRAVEGMGRDSRRVRADVRPHAYAETDGVSELAQWIYFYFLRERTSGRG